MLFITAFSNLVYMKHFDSLDFRNNKKQLLASYLLRLLGLLVFGILFSLVATQINPAIPLSAPGLFSIEIQGLPGFISFVFVFLDVVLVLYLHELIHAAVFYFTLKTPPNIGMRGLVIYAAAKGHYFGRISGIINALAPFTVITIMGFILLKMIPASFASWVFIPLLVNAASAGGDFMFVGWMLKHPAGTLYHDEGDKTDAFHPEKV